MQPWMNLSPTKNMIQFIRKQTSYLILSWTWSSFRGRGGPHRRHICSPIHQKRFTWFIIKDEHNISKIKSTIHTKQSIVPHKSNNDLPQQGTKSLGLVLHADDRPKNWPPSMGADMSLSRSPSLNTWQRQMGAFWKSDRTPSQHLPWRGGLGAVLFVRKSLHGISPISDGRHSFGCGLKGGGGGGALGVGGQNIGGTHNMGGRIDLTTGTSSFMFNNSNHQPSTTVVISWNGRTWTQVPVTCYLTKVACAI